MLTFILFFIIVMLLAAASEKTEFQSEKRKTPWCYLIMCVLLVLVAGLRTEYNDTITYIGSYNDIVDTPLLPDLLRNFRFSFGWNPGFQFVNSLMKSLGFDAHLFIMTYAAFTLISTLRFIRHYSTNIATTTFFFFVTGYFFIFAGIKQAVAAAIMLYAVEAALHRRWLKFVIIGLIAMTFHPYVLLFAVVPFIINKKPWSGTTFLIMLITGILSAFMTLFSSIALQIVNLVGDSFTEEEVITGRGVNIFRVLVYVVCFVVMFIYRHELYDDADPAIKLFFHLHLIAGCFMFTALFGNQILIGRLPAYFNAMTCLNLAYMAETLGKNKRTAMIKPLMFLGFILYSGYEDVLLKPFWLRYNAISVTEFLRSVLKVFRI